MGLDALINENSYPIVFIGSGISKRYLMDSPSWIELLERFWNETNFDNDFYGTLKGIKDNLLEKGNSDLNAGFQANIKIATMIENELNRKFNQKKITIDGLSTKEAYKENISPFKYALSNLFSEATLKDDIEDEFKSWQAFIRKSQIVITTNYDTLIEDSYSDGKDKSLKKYIGQEGFFDNTTGSADLFKIHGCCTVANSIVINEKDYELFNKNSVLISAKILSSLVSSPIIFLGYSLSDANVRKIISDFTSQLPKEDPRISANRIIVIERASGVMNLDEIIVQDSEIGSYTLIKTDNYKAIYDKVSAINQGLTPYEIRRYQDVMKKLIISHGSKGTLDAVLLSPKDLDDVEKDIDMNKPIVVAFGDKKYMYVMPDFITYMKDYVFNEKGIHPTVALKFIAREPIKARIPFARYMNQIKDLNKIELNTNDKINLKNKINTHMLTLDKLIEKKVYNKEKNNNLEDIWSNEEYSTSKKIDLTIYNIKSLDKDELDNFIKTKAFPLLVEATDDRASNLRSPLRKLFYAYDLLKYGDLEKIK